MWHGPAFWPAQLLVRDLLPLALEHTAQSQHGLALEMIV
jgi:hypothetical protein